MYSTQFVIIFITCSSGWYPIWFDKNGQFIALPMNITHFAMWSSSMSIFHHSFLSLTVFYSSPSSSSSFLLTALSELYGKQKSRVLQPIARHARDGKSRIFSKDQMKAIVFTRDSAIALFEMCLETKSKTKTTDCHAFILIFQIYLSVFDVKLMTMGRARMERKRIIH